MRFAFALLATASSAFAGGTLEQLQSDEELLGDWRRDVYVVTVKSVDDHGRTNSHPPTLVLVVKEALQGEAKPGDELEALWMPVQHDIDTGGREEELKHWNEKPLDGPPVGGELLVMSQNLERGGPFLVSFRCRYAPTKEKVEWARGALAKDWKERRAQADAHAVAEKSAHDDSVKSDREAQAKSDVRAMAKEADEIFVAEVWVSAALIEGERTVELYRIEWLRGGPVAPDWTGKQRVFAQGDESTEAVFTTRCGLGSLLVFLKKGEADPEKTWRQRTLMGGAGGILEATEERLEAVREVLAERDKPGK